MHTFQYNVFWLFYKKKEAWSDHDYSNPERKKHCSDHDYSNPEKKKKNTVLQLLKVQFRIHTFITDNKFANSWQVLQGKFRQTAFIPPQNRSLSYQCQLMTLDNIGTYSCSAWSIDIGNRFVNRITPHESLSGPW